MRALLLPIKDLRNAKQRLAGVLSPEQRFGLAQAMLADPMRAVRGVRFARKIFVATNYQPAMLAARESGWEVLREEQQTSESDSVDAASRLGDHEGFTRLPRLPLDLPLVQAKDIDELLQLEFAAPAMVIVPSRDGTGTNAILRTPPMLFRSQFGNGSFAKDTAAGERAGALVMVHRNPRIEMDVDDEADLRVLLQQDLRGTEAGRWLLENRIEAGFRGASGSAGR